MLLFTDCSVTSYSALSMKVCECSTVIGMLLFSTFNLNTRKGFATAGSFFDSAKTFNYLFMRTRMWCKKVKTYLVNFFYSKVQL